MWELGETWVCFNDEPSVVRDNEAEIERKHDVFVLLNNAGFFLSNDSQLE